MTSTPPDPIETACRILRRRQLEIESWLTTRDRAWVSDDQSISQAYPVPEPREQAKFLLRRGRGAIVFILIVGALGALVQSAVEKEDGVPPALVGVAVAIGWAIIVFVQLSFIRSRSAHARQESQRLKYEIDAIKSVGKSQATVIAPRLDKLLERLDVQSSLIEQQRLRDTFFAVAAVSPLIGTAVTVSGATVKGPICAAIFETLIVICYLFSRTRIRQLEQSILQIEYELNLLTTSLHPAQRAERLYLKQQFELKRYYDEALRQSSTLSFLGGFCIFGGFVVVGVTLGVLLGSGDVRETPIVIVGAIGGVLANFVAVVFLGMHSRTIRAMADFHNRLVGTNHLHFANTLLSRMPYALDERGQEGPGKELTDALPDIAREIVRTAAPAADPAPDSA